MIKSRNLLRCLTSHRTLNIWTVLSVLLLFAPAYVSPAVAAIFRWDNGGLITEAIPEPHAKLSQQDLSYADLVAADLLLADLSFSDLTFARF